MKLEFGYGKGIQTVEVPDKNVIDVLMSNPMEHERRGAEAVRWALDHPIASKPLKELVKPGQKIVIVTSDISRPMPSFDALPDVLDDLYAAGCAKEDITVVLALGSHREHTDEEKKKLVGERVYHEVLVEDSDAHGFVHVGDTKHGTPVDIAKRVIEADFRICMGNVEFHYFAGYSGGYKAIMPGCSTPSAIQCNHSMIVSPDAITGKIQGNPIREDIEEAGAMVGIDFILNVVLSEHKEILKAVAGDATEAHRAGCRFLDRLYRKELHEAADIVLVSQGGAPKDLNLYQTQKALDNAKHAVKDGGVIILIGSCKEGLGEKTFEQWMTEADSAHSLIERIGREFKLGGHKAAAIAMVLERAEVDLVSELDDDFVRSIFLKPYKTAQDALDHAFSKLGPDARVLAMPYGGSTLPTVVQ